MFGGLIEEMAEIQLSEGPLLSQEAIVALIDSIRQHDTIYKNLAQYMLAHVFERDGNDGVRLLHFIEDVGRHNAVDSISGLMWLADKPGKELIFFTAGCLDLGDGYKGSSDGHPFPFDPFGGYLDGLGVGSQYQSHHPLPEFRKILRDL